jgi:hypothetical protein
MVPSSGVSSAFVLTSLPARCHLTTSPQLAWVRVRVNLRLEVYRQSFRLDDKPLETHDQYFFPSEHLRSQLLCNILPDERMGQSFIFAAGRRQRSHSQVRVPRDSWPYFTISDWRLPQPGGPGPRIYIPRKSVARLYPPDPGFSFRRLLRLSGLRRRYSTPLPHGISPHQLATHWQASLYNLGTNRIENTVSNSFVAGLHVYSLPRISVYPAVTKQWLSSSIIMSRHSSYKSCNASNYSAVWFCCYCICRSCALSSTHALNHVSRLTWRGSGWQVIYWTCFSKAYRGSHVCPVAI